MKACGVITEQHLLDHLVPLCSLFNAPILCFKREIAHIAQMFYPELNFHTLEKEEQCDSFLQAYDFLIYVHFHRTFPFGFQFVDYLCCQQKRSLFSLHGQPDKFASAYWIERILEEDLVLIYGDKLFDLLKEKDIKHRLKQPIVSGNYRLAYYQKHRLFFQKKITPFLFEDRSKTTILFAPTWSQDHRASQLSPYFSPLQKTCHFLLENIPDNFQLIIKMHPLFLLNNFDYVSELEKKIKNTNNIKLLYNMPLIYPLLEHINIFVGDYSSIGYDFLYFNRPMFFLSNKMRTDLHSCGRVLEEEEWPNCYKIFQEEQAFLSEKRKKTYDYVFGPEKSLTELTKEIEKAYD